MTDHLEITKQTDALSQRDPRGGNPEKHGILSEHIPLRERAGYEQHVQAVRASSGASGYLQERLADRAALALWRLERVTRYEAAQVSARQRQTRLELEAGEKYGPAGAALKAFERVAKLGYESVDVYQREPETAEKDARDWEQEADALHTWGTGGSVEGLESNDNLCNSLGLILYKTLETIKVSSGQMVSAMTGRKAKPSEVEALDNWNWDFSPADVLALVGVLMARELGGTILIADARSLRKKAASIRAAVAEAVGAEHDAQELALIPEDAVLNKVMRYEAHLERVLYRSLHDLEALRREGEGKPTPGPVRGVFDGMKDPEEEH